MNALITKELSQLRGFFIAIAILTLISAIAALLDTTEILHVSLRVQHDLEGSVMFEAAFVLTAALRSVPDEFRGGQIAFLDALPLGRAELFFAKAVAIMVLILALLAGNLSELAIELALRHSTIPEIIAPLASAAMIQGTVCFGAAGVGFLISWTGPLAWFLVAFALMFIEITRWFIPGMTDISMEALDPIYFEPDRLVVPERFLRFWTWVGLSMLLGGGLLFRAPGDLFARLQTTGSKRLGAIAGFGLAGFIILISLLTALFGHERLLKMVRGTTHVIESANFIFSHAEAQTEDAQKLVAEAESIDARVRAIFGGIERPRLIVELTNPGKTHLGDFSQGKIRVPPGDESRRVFTHELAHAYAWVLAGHEQPEWWRFFSEGLATWVEGEAGADTGGLAKQRAHAGLIWRADHHAFGTLADDTVHRARFDSAEAYPLGLVFVEAIVETGGKEKPACLLRALRGHAPNAGAALAMWIGITRECGLDLATVTAAYERLLSKYAESAPELPELPSGRPTRLTDKVMIDVWRGDATPRWCRFRTADSDPLERYDTVEVNAAGYCPVPDTKSKDARVSYQIGADVEGAGVLFGEWIHRPAPHLPPCTTLACLEASDLLEAWRPASTSIDREPWGVRWGHGATITAATFSADGALLATGGWYDGLRIWNAATGELLAVFASPGEARRLAISPDGRLLLVESDAGVELRELESGGLVWSIPRSTARAVFHPQLALVILADKKMIFAIDASSGDRAGELGPAQFFSPDSGELEQIAMHPDGRRLVVAFRKALEVIDLDTRQRERVATIEARPVAIALSPDGERAAIADVKGIVHLYELASGEVTIDDRGDPTIRLGAIAFSPSGRLKWTRDTGAMFELGADNATHRVLSERSLYALAFAHDGRMFGGDRFGGLGRTFDAKGGERIAFGQFGAHLAELQAAGPREVALRTGKRIVFFDPAECEVTGWFNGEEDSALAVSRDGKTAASVEGGTSISVFSTATGRGPIFRSRDRTLIPESIVFSPNGKRLVFSVRKRGVMAMDLRSGRDRVWDEEENPHDLVLRGDRAFWLAGGLRTATISAGGQAFVRRPTDAAHRSLAVGDDGAIAYLGESEGIAAIDVETGRSLGRIEGIDGSAERMVIAGNRLFAINDRGKLYQSSAHPPWAAEPVSQVHLGSPSGLVHVAESDLLVSSGEDGMLAVFDIAADELTCAVLFDRNGEHTYLPRVPF